MHISSSNLSIRVKSPRNGHSLIFVNFSRKVTGPLLVIPASLTCIPCKLLEHIVCSNIMGHLDHYNLLSDKQHAFKKWHNCETQLIEQKYWTKRAILTLSFWTLKKRLTLLHTNYLFSKLFSYGIGGKTLEWINACFVLQAAKGSS